MSTSLADWIPRASCSSIWSFLSEISPACLYEQSPQNTALYLEQQLWGNIWLIRISIFFFRMWMGSANFSKFSTDSLAIASPLGFCSRAQRGKAAANPYFSMMLSNTTQSLKPTLTACHRNGTIVCAASPINTALLPQFQGSVYRVPKQPIGFERNCQAALGIFSYTSGKLSCRNFSIFYYSLVSEKLTSPQVGRISVREKVPLRLGWPIMRNLPRGQRCTDSASMRWCPFSSAGMNSSLYSASNHQVFSLPPVSLLMRSRTLEFAPSAPYRKVPLYRTVSSSLAKVKMLLLKSASSRECLKQRSMLLFSAIVSNTQLSLFLEMQQLTSYSKVPQGRQAIQLSGVWIALPLITVACSSTSYLMPTLSSASTPRLLSMRLMDLPSAMSSCRRSQQLSKMAMEWLRLRRNKAQRAPTSPPPATI